MLVVLACAFTGVGGTLVLARSWTSVDRAQRAVVKEWGLLIPFHAQSTPLDGYAAVRLDFVEGDSDSSDKYPVALKARTGADLTLGSFTDYAQARECARAIAEHLQFEIEDASTDHFVRGTAAEFDVPLRERLRRAGTRVAAVDPPPGARSRVTREMGEVTIVVPSRPWHPLAAVAALIPLAIPIVFGPPFAAFFRQTRTPDQVGWVFLGFLTLCFGILPAAAILGGFLRSRLGATIVAVSREGIRIRQRGVWSTRAVASFDAADILDVDYSSNQSRLASAKRAAEQQALAAYPDVAAETGPRLERLIAALTRFATGKGVVVKSRTGLTSFGQGLADDELRYLHAVVRRALVE